MKLFTVVLFALLFTGCQTFNINDSSSQFFGTYQSLPLSDESVELHLEDEGRGFFILKDKKKVPVLWRESLGKLILSYTGNTDRYEPMEWVSPQGQVRLAIKYLDRPEFPKGPFSPIDMVKVK